MSFLRKVVKLTQYLKNFGLDYLEEETNCLMLIRHVCEKGKVFRGYRCNYLYKNFGYAEMIVTTVDEDNNGNNRVVGFNNHKIGNCFWKLKVAAPEIFDRDEMNPYTFRVVFKDLDGKGVFPINLIHADVIPSYLENDIVCMQVVAFPLSVDYYATEDDCDNAHKMVLMGKPLVVGNGIFPVGLFGKDEECKDVVSLKGQVIDVNKRKIFVDDREIEFLDVTIDTRIGPIELAHTIDFVKEAQHELIKPGSLIETSCILSGDVAIEEYQGGAVYDEENELRLIRSCMKHGDFDRLWKALAEDCSYLTPITSVHGKQDVIARLNSGFQRTKKEQVEHFTSLATVGKIEEEKSHLAKYGIGKRCIALASNEPDAYNGWMFLSTNEEGKIRMIETVSGASNCYLVRIDKHVEPEDFFNGTPIQIERDQDAWLQLIKECYDNMDFDRQEFYFGMEPTIELSLQWNSQVIEDKEIVYGYFTEEVKKIEESGQEFHTEIVVLQSPQPENGLLISVRKRKTLITIELSERNRLQAIHISLSS